MKRLLLGIAIFVLLISVVVGRVRTGSGTLTATQASEMTVQSIIAQVEQLGVSIPRSRLLGGPAAQFLEPGAFLITRLGILPESLSSLAFVVVASWWIWVAAVRSLWTVVGRGFGFASTAHFHLWLRLVPPWRPPYRLWLTIRRWFRQFIFGKRATASWTGALAAMTLPYKPADSVFIGLLWAHGVKLYQPLGIRGPRHITVVAASGSGKTRWLKGWIGMLPKQASAFVIDCDGEIVNTVGPALARAGHRVLNLDPYRLSNFPGACWNALDELTAAAERHGRESVVRFSQTLAEALIREDNSSQPIFSNGARNFLQGLILYVWLFEPVERHNLVRVRELLTRGMPELIIDPKQNPFDLLLRRMDETVGHDDGCDGKICAVIARAAAVMKSGKGRDGNPFRTTAMSQTAWLDLPEIEAISKYSDFTTEDLKTGNPCVFACAPVTDIQSKLSGWVRALTMMAMYAFQNMPGQRKSPCAFCIDEMPSLGRMEILETAAPVFRKYGIRLVVITQDLERLKQIYPKSWGGFIGNSQATIWMGTDHQETLEHLSKILGTATHVQKVDGGLFSKVPPRMERREQPLMTPDQLREFLDPERKQIIVTRTGKPPIKVAYEGYDKALPVWRYEHDRNFREPFLRACTRRLLGWLRPPKSLTGVGTAPRR